MIAFDASAADATALPASTLTWAHTCTGLNLILFVFVGGGGSTGDCITGITYGGVAMTRAPNGFKASGDVTTWLYYLVAPSSGANNVVASSSSSQFLRGVSVSYTGTKQTGQPDASANGGAAPGTSVSSAPTTIADNCWVVSGAIGAVGTLSASTGVSSVRTNRDSVVYIGDTNGPITPAGSQTMAWTGANQNLATIAASFSPAPAGGGETGAFFLNNFV